MDRGFGLILVGPTGALRGKRIAIAAGMPPMRNLNEPQKETDFTLSVGWQYAFQAVARGVGHIYDALSNMRKGSDTDE